MTWEQWTVAIVMIVVYGGHQSVLFAQHGFRDWRPWARASVNLAIVTGMFIALDSGGFW